MARRDNQPHLAVIQRGNRAEDQRDLLVMYAAENDQPLAGSNSQLLPQQHRIALDALMQIFQIARSHATGRISAQGDESIALGFILRQDSAKAPQRRRNESANRLVAWHIFRINAPA